LTNKKKQKGKRGAKERQANKDVKPGSTWLARGSRWGRQEKRYPSDLLITQETYTGDGMRNDRSAQERKKNKMQSRIRMGGRVLLIR